VNMLLDPVWSERASPFRFAGPKRVNDPGIAFADLPPIDVVLVSHAHYDHLDVATCGGASRARHHTARQRHHHAQTRSRDRGGSP
jgi:L-ascorbate metabolism protein UlaG (beta-lactamase superfamily)